MLCCEAGIFEKLRLWESRLECDDIKLGVPAQALLEGVRDAVAPGPVGFGVSRVWTRALVKAGDLQGGRRQEVRNDIEQWAARQPGGAEEWATSGRRRESGRRAALDGSGAALFVSGHGRQRNGSGLIGREYQTYRTHCSASGSQITRARTDPTTIFVRRRRSVSVVVKGGMTTITSPSGRRIAPRFRASRITR